MERVLASIVVVEKLYYINWVCVGSLGYPEYDAYAPYCHLWSSTKVVRSIPISDAGGQCETKQSHRRGKEWWQLTTKKDDVLSCWTGSSDISAYHTDFHEGTALSEHGMGTAWHVWVNATVLQGKGMATAWAQNAVCESAVSRQNGRHVTDRGLSEVVRDLNLLVPELFFF
jgi:hypothetical protein